ncbi:MAG TPA: SDR family oxidoreductase [Anaerolineales bacterium]|nr:SDR family oxidoreductase [Anaerolineales bacterium]
MKRTIVITGATGALGQLAAKTFAEMGASLALLDNDQTKLNALVKELDLPKDRLFTSVVDLRDEQAVQDSAEAVSNKFGSVHALFHLVGGWIGGKTIAVSPLEDLESMLGQHVITTFHLFKAFSPKLSASGWGRVITISPSTVADPPAERGVYNATKAAQENLVMTLAQELKDSGVTANIIQVHSIDVMNKGTGTTPTAIVATMQYLFSEQASKVNGAKIPLF